MKKTAVSPHLLPLPIFALLSLALQPLLRGHLPWQGDGLLHFVRLAQLERAIRFSDFFPRWSADLGYGYGFPLFNFYAPFSYYISVIPHLLGVPLSLSLQISYAMAMGTMAMGAFLWARKIVGDGAGTTAVISLIYTPYLLYNLYHRAALAELWGLAWLLVTLWAVAGIGDRGSGDRDRGRWMLGAAISYALLILSHNITAMIGTPVLIGYLLFTLWQKQSHSLLKIHYSLFIILPFALAAFFWLPAFFEKESVQIENLYASANFTYENHFLTLKELFAWPQTADSARVNPPVPRSLSWPVLLLAAFAWLPRKQISNSLRAALSISAAGLIFMTLPVSKPIWDGVTLLQFVQFPWRFLGLATIPLALLAALGMQNVSRRLPAALVHPAAITLILLFALPWLFPSPSPLLPARMTPVDTINFERETGWLGTTAAADYLPRTVQQLPAADSLLLRYEAAADGLIDRLLTPITARETEENLTDSTLEYDLEAQTAVSFARFAFPSWQGTVDGEPIPLGISEPEGLITAVLPAGSHTFRLTLANSRLQTAANAISALALVLTLLLIAHYSLLIPRSPFPIHYSVFFPVLFFLLLKTAVFDHATTPFHQIIFDGQTLTNAINPLQINFGDQIMLLGAEAPITPVPADEEVDITLFWRALPPVDGEYSVSVQLVDANNRLLAQSDSFHPANMPLPRWQAGAYGQDDHHLIIPPATPPALYQLRLFVYRLDGGQRLDILNSDGLPIGNAYPIGQIAIAPPTVYPGPAAVNIGQRLEIEMSKNVELLGIDQPFEQIEAGQTLPIAFYWYTPQPPTAVYKTAVTLDCGEQGILAEASPVAPDPTWQAGQLLRAAASPHIQPITNDGAPVTNGDCTLMLNGIALQSLALTAPPHSFTAPAFSQPSGAKLGDVATLQGYDVETQDGNVTVQLFWQADGVTDESYTVFVQMLDENGRVLAQQDHIPADGKRPTTGWVPHEFIGDSYTLPLPADSTTYRLIVGLYQSDSLQRLPRRDQNGDSITLVIKGK